MYPTTNKIFAPQTANEERDLTIEEVRQYGQVVALSEDGTKATVQVKIGLTVCYCGVIMDGDLIKEFIPRPKTVHTCVLDGKSEPDTSVKKPPE